jgi:hypothetical protein
MSVELWKSIFDWAAVVLIGFTFIAGAGALITGKILSNRQDDKLREFSTDLTTAQTELGRQQERAAKAEGQIASAEQHAAEANAKAESFRLDIAKANESAARAQAQVAEATAEAAKANLELARIKAPRTLTSEQQLRIANKMFPFAGQQFAPYVFADAESQSLVNLIGISLISAKWIIAEPKSDLKMGKAGVTTRSGVHILFAPSRSGDIGVIARKLAEALNAEGIEALAEPDPTELEKTPDVIYLIVGSKSLD